MVVLFYPALALLLLLGAKVSGRQKWNEEVLSYRHTKDFLGFMAVLIIFHHVSQRTCAPWLNPSQIVHGLDPFVYTGYLCVAVFFFCSGYGMYTSSRKRKDDFKGLLLRRLLPILIPSAVMWLVFYGIERARDMRIEPPLFINVFTYIWYISAILFLYLLFFVAFDLVKNERAGLFILLAGTVGYSVACFFFSPGTWWYNTHHLFLIGVLVGKNRERVLETLKRGYPGWIALMTVLTAVGFFLSNYYAPIISFFGGRYTDAGHFIGEFFGQAGSAVTFSFLMLLIGMKVHIGNPVLRFLGGFTLEIYLVHPLFVQLFGFSFVDDWSGPVCYIQNQSLYLLAVIALTIPLAFLLHRAVSAGTARKSTPNQKYSE